MAGVDMSMQSGLYAAHLPDLVASGEVPMDVIDQGVRRVFAVKQAIGLFDKIAAAAENANHHPDVLWSYNEITVDLSSHDVGGVTQRDTRLAKTISGLAEAAGAVVDLFEQLGVGR